MKISVSVIIPARNAAATLAETIGSLRTQTFTRWEAVIIDDGSTDGTLELARSIAAQDERVRVVEQSGQGVGVARNRGIDEARHDWILFLDADDRIKPTHLAKLTTKIEKDSNLDGAYCGFARVTDDGTVVEECIWWEPQDLFRIFACSCPWTVHCVVLRKSIIQKVGGFLPGWKTCEDWDLWQRVTRTGARFALVPEILALYRIRPDSASMDAGDMARGTIAVVTRGHATDDRVDASTSEFAPGLPEERAASARMSALCWPAGLLIGRGLDARPVLDTVPEDSDPAFSALTPAECIFRAALLPTCQPPSSWLRLWPEFEANIDLFLAALEQKTGAPNLARRARNILEQRVLSQAPLWEDHTLGRVCSSTVELTRPIPDQWADEGIERLCCNVVLDGDLLGSVQVPVCDGFVPASVLADVISYEFTWTILERFQWHTVYPRIRQSTVPIAAAGRRLATFVSRALPKGRRHEIEQWAFTSIGQVALHRDLFRKDPVADGKREAGEVQAAGGRVRIEISHPIPNVQVDEGALIIELTLGGVPLGLVELRAQERVVKPSKIRRAILDACGAELNRVVVREALLGQPFDEVVSIRQKLSWLADLRDSQSTATRFAVHEVSGPIAVGSFPTYLPNGDSALLAGRRLGDGIGTSASRRAVVPRDAMPELLELSWSAGEPVVEVNDPEGTPDRAFYAPEVVVYLNEKGATSPSRVITASSSRRLLDGVTRFAQRAFPPLRKFASRKVIADKLPILMYHRIVGSGPVGLAPYRVSPAQFEEQLRYFKEAGYYSVGLEEWRAAAERRKQLHGKPLLITFDDGYMDFMSDAWPLLRKYGFTAINFLVTSEVGRANHWDAAYGEEVPLMGWNEILTLQGEGAVFGSHTVSHPPLTSLSPREIVHEAARSRRTLERKLGRAVKAMAYPYGDVDPIVRHLVGACGYVFGFTTREEVTRYYEPLLELPRINVEGSWSVEQLARRIERQRGGKG